MARRSDKREYLMLAHKYDPKKHSCSGKLASIKMDGQRAFSDGGISRGKVASSIPWANTVKDKKEVIATGLWSRNGKVIYAPEYFLDNLPPIPLDGELYAGRGGFQLTESVVKDHVPGAGWRGIKLHVFDSPPLSHFSIKGRIHTQGWETVLNFDTPAGRSLPESTQYYMAQEVLKKFPENDSFKLVEQTMLSVQTKVAEEQLAQMLAEEVALGGEGIMLRNPSSYWLPYRSYDLLKVKPLDDEEGTVVGYRTGKVTDKDSRNLGRMGTLLVQNEQGLIYGISGFTDSEREFDSLDAVKWATEHPDSELPSCFENKRFPRGLTVTYTYIGRSDIGIPKHANFKRPKHV